MTAIRPGAVADKFAAANRRSTLFCQIETAEGVENADEIAALDGVDCLWVGHFDLSVLARHSRPIRPPEIQASDRRDLRRLQEAQQGARPARARCRDGHRCSTLGFDFVCYSGDVWVSERR